MLDYRAPIADILHALHAASGAERLPGWDEELADEIITQAGRFIDAEIAPLDAIADSQPARLVEGRVRLPEPFVSAYRQLRDGGWVSLAAPEEYGGQGLPKILAGIFSEMVSSACVSFQMLPSLGQGAMRTLIAHGDAEQKARYMPRLASGDWLATMCLSESTAGSDLGQIRTTATADAEGKWLLSGTKIFISGGDHDLTENLVHLVLARTPEAPPGVRGLALFTCSALLEDGSRNRISVLRLEEKMGLHASPTCQMAFDAAEAEILGAPGEGLAKMFTMMNAERLDVAVQGVGIAEIAAQRAWSYALERRQGRAPGSGNALDSIARHGDVQRMLLEQRALVLGTRALVYRMTVELELGERPALVEFMTPVCKAFCSEAGVRAADLGIQIHGGYGYCKEYRAEQILRDARISTIYEGTNGIQAMTVAGRLLQLSGGACIEAFAEEIESAIGCAGQAGLSASSAALTRALADWRSATGIVADNPAPGMVAVAYLRLTGLVAFAAAWCRIESAADSAPDGQLIRTTARFVHERMLPETAWLKTQMTVDGSLGEQADALFSAL